MSAEKKEEEAASANEKDENVQQRFSCSDFGDVDIRLNDVLQIWTHNAAFSKTSNIDPNVTLIKHRFLRISFIGASFGLYVHRRKQCWRLLSTKSLKDNV